MAKYTIHRWDPIVYGNNINPFPTIYIKPDKEFLDFVNENKGAVIVKIDGTNTIYDGKAMVGVVNSTASKPTCMPNYFNKTDYYTIGLYAHWYEYPQENSLGVATITGLKGKYKVPPVEVPPYIPPAPVSEPFTMTKKDCCGNNLSTTQIVVLVLGIISIMAVLIWIFMSTRKK